MSAAQERVELREISRLINRLYILSVAQERYPSGFKRCPDCGCEKQICQFSALKTGYLNAYCKPCAAARSRAAKQKNQGKTKSAVAKWRAENRDRLKELSALRPYTPARRQSCLMSKKKMVCQSA